MNMQEEPNTFFPGELAFQTFLNCLTRTPGANLLAESRLGANLATSPHIAAQGFSDRHMSPERWDSALDHLLQSMGASGGSLLICDDEVGDTTRVLLRTRGDFVRVMEEYVGEHMANDPQRVYFQRPGFIGRVSDTSLPSELPSNHRAYLKWQADRCRVTHFLTVTARIGAKERLALSLHNDESRGPVSRGQANALSHALDGVRKAVANHAREERLLLDGFWLGRSASEDGCVAFIGARGKIECASDLFQSYLDRGGIIRSISGHLVCVHTGAQRSLIEALQSTWYKKPLSRFVDLQPSARGRRIYMQIDSIPLEHPLFGISPGLILKIIDPAYLQKRVEKRAQAAFALTMREVDVADALMAGHTVESAAQFLGISTATCRVHLANLSRKLGVNRQADIIRVFSAW